MRKKIIFIDVDGTLINDYGIVPKSAEIAIREARKRGHYVFLCTGRSKAELFQEIMGIGFDGVIAAAGGYIEVDDKVIMHKKMDTEHLKHLVKYFYENSIEFYLESNGGLFASKNFKNRLKEIVYENPKLDSETMEEFEKMMNTFIKSLIEEEDLIREDINKVSFLGSAIPIEIIKEEFKTKLNVIPSTVAAFGENSGELSILGIHKATAIEILLEHLGLSKEDTFAYGDGINDAEMLEFVNIGVAMGNAKESLKEIAADVTDTVDEDGIYNSFKKYGLI